MRTRVSRRAMLYVPGSNPRMLEKSLVSPADSVSYDLEDSVAPSKKSEARKLIGELLDGERRPKGEVMVRINAVGTGNESADLDDALRTRHIQAIALPKTTDPEHIEWVVSRIQRLCPKDKQTGGSNAIRIIAMIENAIGMIRIEQIAQSGQGHLDALLFAAEDYCADVGLIRTENRLEMLYARSKLVTTAKAFGLQAIDLVCVNYKDPEALRIESEEGRRLGFDGKQAIHPDQIEIIHRAFAPSPADIEKALKIRDAFEKHDLAGRGAFELDEAMIDAPMQKQALRILAKAKAAGLV
ncbi:Pyruvate/Phosphoenolpyruvate kinase-like domain-containing protein [Naematelia encephala]|uniref:Pyruvate/Phosphoenolpyruvate kinase-like domain-containing protein n=1 Tax=Naematelia encephala TaxID=71784 RepID=A0A1Y2AFJ8_9TREE|nr:Pyruvate/Phosphoenolpyruvate kinase-like domain-containing protein [Naematelia encephala]